MGRIRTGFIMVAVLVFGVGAGCSDEAGDHRTAQAGPGSSTGEAPGDAESGGGSSAGAESGTEAGPAAEAPPAPADARSTEELAAAGRAVYNANCIACHAMDPRIDGALGPAVAGASAELIAARVLRAEYPEGHTPKRETRVMVPLPHLEPKLPELTAYLQSLE